MTGSPVFGIRLEGCRYVVRPSAYALLRDEEGRFAIVRSARGWFLPGGGIEGSESPEQAVERETREECGLVIEAQQVVATATEIVHSPTGSTGIDKVSVFIEGIVVGVTSQTETGHVLEWVHPGEASTRLAHRSHRWAIDLVAGVGGGVSSHIDSA